MFVGASPSRKARNASGCGNGTGWSAVDALTVLAELCATAFSTAPNIGLFVGIGLAARGSTGTGVDVEARAIVHPTIRRKAVGIGLSGHG
jgi:hypothetical protein